MAEAVADDRRVTGRVQRPGSLLVEAGDLPVEEPAKLDFVVNLRTARTLGIMLPDSFVARADEVIE